jgi:hypothetical protein
VAAMNATFILRQLSFVDTGRMQIGPMFEKRIAAGSSPSKNEPFSPGQKPVVAGSRYATRKN